jgi:IS605 OrfB family transposase
MNKNQKNILSQIQLLSEENKGCFTIELDNNYVYIIIDECLVKTKEERNIIKDRILSFDLNPNYIGLSVVDWKDQDNKNIVHKEIISLKLLNDIDVKGLPSTDKKKIKVNNKRKYEIMQISKYIINLVKHYKCETLTFEKLNIKSQQHHKGKAFNKLVNNLWLRNPLLNNLKKRCNINNINYQEIIPQYSSFIGQINNPDEIDSIAASLELSRRCYLFNKIYKEKSLTKQNIIFPKFNVDSLNDRWKKTLKNNLNNIKSWIELYNVFKKSKTSYRFLFSCDLFKGNSLRLFSVNSNIMVHKFT